jgi:hypothetical protein
MTSEDCHGCGQPGGDRPEHAHQPASGGQGPLTQPLVLELILGGGEPLSGTVGNPGDPAPVAFHGWIDLMSAIHLLRAARHRPGRQNST